MVIERLQLELPYGPHGRDLGAVYTPQVLASWVARQLRRYVRATDSPVILDPACGDGALLSAADQAWGGNARLVGWDIDPAAVDAATRSLAGHAKVAVQDGLMPTDLGRYLEIRPDAVIVNPPWGTRLDYSSAQLRASGLELASGQFDAFELFVERLVKVFSNGCVMACILPDSVLLPEHQGLRRLLLQSTRLHLLARLGEGFFSGVYRGTIVVVLETGEPDESNLVECFRLGPADRRSVLAGRSALEEAQTNLSHFVPQSRFAENSHLEFNLDLRDDEVAVDKMTRQPSLEWNRWLIVGRGVEIGKQGLAIRCTACGTYRVTPKAPEFSLRCAGCKRVLDTKLVARSQIIRHRKGRITSPWRRLIVGEDVTRYRRRASREVLIGLPGIKYNEAPLPGIQRLLVRKTGIGLQAALDDSKAFTIQTVFHVLLREGAPDFLLEYIVGVLNSRIMLAYYLRWHGENEWRSHPYVTPKVLRQLPIPSPWNDRLTWDKAAAIAESVRLLHSHRDSNRDLDLQIERLVAELYNFDSADCAWAVDVLNEAQPLEAIRRLRVADPAILNPRALNQRRLVFA